MSATLRLTYRLSAGILFWLGSMIQANAQSVHVFDPDTRAYPLMRAKLLVLDRDGNPVRDLTVAQIALVENGLPREVLSVTCPPAEEPRPISSVLTIDISGSMLEGGLDIAKAAAHEWVSVLRLGRSECAITAFDSENYFIQDFTRDREKLVAALDRLEAGGGTSFDAAFYYPYAGALLVAQRAAHQPVIVLLTDGMALGVEAEIVSRAQKIGAIVHCIILDQPIPPLLRHVAEQTGGLYFEYVRSADQASDIYRLLVEISQDSGPCVIEWRSGSCDYFRQVQVDVPPHGTSNLMHYAIPPDRLPGLLFAASSLLRFGVVEPGRTSDLQVTMTAVNSDIAIDAFQLENALFSIVDYGGPPPPFVLLLGGNRTLTVRYAPMDSTYTLGRIVIESEACGPSTIYLVAGDEEKREKIEIRLVHPNGGEVFIAGSDTVITWEGVAPDEAVDLQYSTDGGASWMSIAKNVSGLSYAWHVPATPSGRCLARVTLRGRPPVVTGMVLVPAGSFQMGDLTGFGSPDEKPVHKVTITRGFLMGKYEVTQREWFDVTGYNNSRFPGDDRPVEQVSWLEAVRYCNARAIIEGLDTCYTGEPWNIVCNFDANGYRLPSEAEWEYACRAGTTTDFYTGRMDEPYCSPVDEHLNAAGWYCGNSGVQTSVVGLKQANVYELYDMHGNVSEWCWDFRGVYPPGEQSDPGGPDSGTIRVVRGGSWHAFSYSSICRSSARTIVVSNPLSRSERTGLRVVRRYE